MQGYNSQKNGCWLRVMLPFPPPMPERGQSRKGHSNSAPEILDPATPEACPFWELAVFDPLFVGS